MGRDYCSNMPFPKTGAGKRPQSGDFSTATNISGTYNQLIKTCNKLNKLTDDKCSEMYYEINQLKSENSVIDKQENGDYYEIGKDDSKNHFKHIENMILRLSNAYNFSQSNEDKTSRENSYVLQDSTTDQDKNLKFGHGNKLNNKVCNITRNNDATQKCGVIISEWKPVKSVISENNRRYCATDLLDGEFMNTNKMNSLDELERAEKTMGLRLIWSDYSYYIYLHIMYES